VIKWHVEILWPLFATQEIEPPWLLPFGLCHQLCFVSRPDMLSLAVLGETFYHQFVPSQPVRPRLLGIRCPGQSTLLFDGESGNGK
jgi:hypothetical protein